jgi:hypothetical protein
MGVPLFNLCVYWYLFMAIDNRPKKVHSSEYRPCGPPNKLSSRTEASGPGYQKLRPFGPDGEQRGHYLEHFSCERSGIALGNTLLFSRVSDFPATVG